MAGWTAGEGLGPLAREVTQRQMDLYGEVGGSNGRIHLDPDWAGPRFGGTVTQGMMLLGLVEELITQRCPPVRWAAGGRLSAKFVGMTRPGDTVTARAVVDELDDTSALCSFSCLNQKGETVIVGTARVPVGE